jgi:hypothetical protein
VNGMGAISELYHGRLGPSHSIKPDNIRYHQLLDKCSELREKLEPQLSEDGLAVFAELYDMQAQMASLEMEMNYIEGFRDGAAVMTDVLAGEQHTRG